jgi:hypothetical protein
LMLRTSRNFDCIVRGGFATPWENLLA